MSWPSWLHKGRVSRRSAAALAHQPSRGGVTVFAGTPPVVYTREPARRPRSRDVAGWYSLATFSASRYSAEDRARPNYLGPGDDLAGSLEIVSASAAEALGASPVRRSVRLRPTKEPQALIGDKNEDDDPVVGTIDLGLLIDYIFPDAAVRPSQVRDPHFTTCMAELEAERRMDKILRPGQRGHGGRCP
jgi:hypothetical protein